jgi:hypothetical protein
MGLDPQSVFCPNPDCPARGRIGQGNIRIHSHKERRCHAIAAAAGVFV